MIDIDSGAPVDLGGVEVGDWVFGLDANAFQKSVFVGQNGFGFDGSTAGLRNRLNLLVNEADDTAGLDDALDALDTRRKYYKKQGNHGHIAEISEQMNRLLERQRVYDGQVAEVGHLQLRMGEIDERMARVTQEASEASARLEQAQSGEQELKALLGVGKQLEDRKRELDEEARAFDSEAGSVPSAEELEGARRDADALGAKAAEAERARERVRIAAGRSAELTARHGGAALTKDEVESRRAELAELAHQMEVLQLAAPADSGKFAALEERMQVDPGLLARADALVARWGSVQDDAARAQEVQGELEALNAAWQADAGHVRELLDEHRAAARALPDRAEERAEACEAAERQLSEVSRKVPELLANLRAAHGQSERIEAELGNDASMPRVSLEKIGSIEERLEQCAASADRLSRVREESEGAEDGPDDPFALRDEADERARTAQAALAEARAARADAKNAQADARDARAKAESEQVAGDGAGKTPALACLAAGVAALATGVVLGPATPAAFAAYALGVVLLVAGVVMLGKAKGAVREHEGAVERATAAGEALDRATKVLESREAELVELQAKADEAQREQEAAEEACKALASERKKRKDELLAAIEADKEAKGALIDLFEPYFADEQFDPDTVTVKAPAYIERMKAAEGRLADLEESRAKEAALAEDLRAWEGKARAACEQAGLGAPAADEGAGDSPEDSALCPYALVAGQKAGEARALAAELREALATEKAALARVKRSAAKLLDASEDALDLESIEKACAAQDSPKAGELVQTVKDARSAFERYRAELDPVLDVAGVQLCEDTSLAVERLSQTLESYRAYRSEADRALESTAETRKQIDALAESLDGWACALGLEGRAALSAETLDALAADADAMERAGWEERAAREALDEAERAAGGKVLGLRSFAARYGMEVGQESPAELAKALPELLDRLAGLVACKAELESGLSLASKQLSEWREQNAERLEAARQQVAQDVDVDLKEHVAALQSEREELLAARSQYEERRSVLLEELEGYPAVAQEIKLLSQRKQEATARLNTVLRTAELLSDARRSLDNRYLGGLTMRFNDYTETLLEDEGLSVVVGSDFDVAVAKDGSAHDVASYSSGYRDLLDLCFRMALVDTVFEGEPPFIVMDDPFANLDAGKISRAMMLLALLAQGKQIIYFTCHASRMGSDSDVPEVSFALPEQRAARELPRARAQREAEERARAQAALVASYHVVGATGGRASIRIAGGNRVISSNIVTLRFELDPSSGSRDNAFEVHFIDAKGRALCERQSVEVIDERVVPDRVRLSLASGEDSGDAFDLIVHEAERDESELVDRVSFDARIAFSSDDFDF